jgi:hypothetical protein
MPPRFNLASCVALLLGGGLGTLLASEVTSDSRATVPNSPVTGIIARVQAMARDRDWSDAGKNVPEVELLLRGTDPGSLDASMHALAEEPGGSAALSLLVGGLAARDPDRAIEFVRKISSIELRRVLFYSLTNAIALSDPERAFKLWFSEPVLAEQGRADQLRSILRAWLMKDQAGAAAAVARLDPKHRETATQALAAAMAEFEPESVWNWARTQPATANVWNDPRVVTLANWGRENPAAAARAALTLPAGPARALTTVQSISRYAREDFDAALEMAMKLPGGPERADALAQLAGAAKDHPKMLRILLEQVPTGSSFAVGLRSLFQSWSEADPAGAAAAYPGVPAGALAPELTGFITRGWIKAGGRDAAWVWAQTLPPGTGRNTAVGTIFGSWAETAPLDARQAALGLAPEDRLLAVGAVAGRWTMRDPKGLLGWLGEIGDAKLRVAVVRVAIQKWAELAPDEAADWAAGSPADVRERAVSEVAARWIPADIEKASAWLNRLPVAPWRDTAVIQLTRVLADYDPLAAMAWLKGVSAQNRRDVQTQEVYRTWRTYDEAAAEAWAAETGALQSQPRAR